MNTTTVNLKDNMYLTVNGQVPKTAQKLISASLPFLSEAECKWYVNEVKENEFRHYSNAETFVNSAWVSLKSALQKLVGGDDVKKVKFTIYQTNN